MKDIDVSKLLRAIEVAYQMEDGELDAFVNDSQDEEDDLELITPNTQSTDTRLILDSALGNIGLVSVLKNIAKTIPNPAESEVMQIFIDDTTSRLSDQDLEALTDMVADSLADFTI